MLLTRQERSCLNLEALCAHSVLFSGHRILGFSLKLKGGITVTGEQGKATKTVICPALAVAGAGKGNYDGNRWLLGTFLVETPPAILLYDMGVDRGGLSRLRLFYEKSKAKWTTTAESNLRERTNLLLCNLLESSCYVMARYRSRMRPRIVHIIVYPSSN